MVLMDLRNAGHASVELQLCTCSSRDKVQRPPRSIFLEAATSLAPSCTALELYR